MSPLGPWPVEAPGRPHIDRGRQRRGVLHTPGSWSGESMVAGDVEMRLISRDWFRPGRPIALGHAPARLDVMGGIADYSGATVLELPLALGVRVAAQFGDGLLAVRTDGPAVPPLARPDVAVPVAVLQAGPPA